MPPMARRGSSVSNAGKKKKRPTGSVTLRDERIEPDERELLALTFDNDALDTITDQLRFWLFDRSERVVSILTRCDDERVGHIDRPTFRSALLALGLTVPPEPTGSESVDLVFDSLDVSGEGSIEFAELRELLKRSLDNRPRLPYLRAIGGGVDGQMAGKASFGPPQAPRGELSSAPDRLRSALYKGRTRAVELFRTLDEFATGELASEDFAQGVRKLGLAGTQDEMLTLFHGLTQQRST